MVGMCAVATTQRNWSVGGHLLAQLFVARSRVLSSLQLGAVLIVPWRCIGPASSCTVILLAENGLAPGVSMQVAVYPLHVAVLLRLLGVRGLSPILARSVVVLSISAVWSIGPAVCPVIFFSVTWVFVALGFQCVYGMALFGVGLRPGNTIGFNEGLLLSCVFASCSSCSLALVVMAAAEWGKKRGGAATQLLTPLQNVNSHGKATHTCSRRGPGLDATRQRGDACIPPLQQDCAH